MSAPIKNGSRASRLPFAFSNCHPLRDLRLPLGWLYVAGSVGFLVFAFTILPLFAPLLESMGKDAIVVRADGHNVPELLDAVLTLMPLDQYTEKPAALMEVVPGDDCKPTIWDKYRRLLENHSENPKNIEMMERFAFYERAKKAYAIVATGETAIYANILLKKGVVQ